MRASDGASSSSRDRVVVNIDTRNLADGRHVMYVLGFDASGIAGTPSAIHLTVRRALPRHDYNGDRRADLLWRNYSTGHNAIWRSADSRNPTPVATVATTWKLVAQGDFDGDGRSDVVWR